MRHGRGPVEVENGSVKSIFCRSTLTRVVYTWITIVDLQNNRPSARCDARAVHGLLDFTFNQDLECMPHLVRPRRKGKFVSGKRPGVRKLLRVNKTLYNMRSHSAPKPTKIPDDIQVRDR